MKLVADMGLEELAVYVSEHLRQHDIDVVLVGGACVSLYTNNQYQTLDLDFVERHFTKRSALRAALAEIGFIEERRYFTHSDTKYFLEFPSAPISVGNEPVYQFHSHTSELGTLVLLTATDIAKDRLAAYFYWNDQQCLVQAVNVAKSQQVNIAEIERWASQEGELQKFEEFAILQPPHPSARSYWGKETTILANIWSDNVEDALHGVHSGWSYLIDIPARRLDMGRV